MLCDIFCKIIDNFGDIGVCWRLARQLASEHGLTVTLWVDDLPTFTRLAPKLDLTQPRQRLGPIVVRHWTEETLIEAEPADLVIEGFACRLPAYFLSRMKLRHPHPLWINLEYLSAESWVEDCHLKPSIHPETGLIEYFWFPGFTPETGGLIREGALIDVRKRFQKNPLEQLHFFEKLGLSDSPFYSQRISLFCYETPSVGRLLDTLKDYVLPTLLLVCEGRPCATVNAHLGLALSAGDKQQIGSLTVAILPLLSHEDYDLLLWSCDLNIIRGEDSFVRAQWAAKPLLWHIYPQEENAHMPKLEAFIHQMEAHTPAPGLWTDAMRAWNLGAGLGSEDLLSILPQLQESATQWCEYLTLQSDLASQLLTFIHSRHVNE